MASATRPGLATLDDLMRFDGKAELIAGRIVPLMPTGLGPSRKAARIAQSLDDHARATGRGVALTDGVGYAVPEVPSGREAFSPDASYYVGPLPPDEMDFVAGPPTLAVEVRSKRDHGPAAEAEMAAQRADYFAAGTLVVWDVDPRAGTICRFRADAPDQPLLYIKGQLADAEPAVPGWHFPVAALDG